MLEVVLGSGGPTALTRIFDPSRLPALRPSRLMSAEGSVWVEGGCAGSGGGHIRKREGCEQFNISTHAYFSDGDDRR